jgi:hypothetical protein
MYICTPNLTFFWIVPHAEKHPPVDPVSLWLRRHSGMSRYTTPRGEHNAQKGGGNRCRRHAILIRWPRPLSCAALGVHVCLATGRIPGPWVDTLRQELPFLGPCVFGNGAIVMDADGELIWTTQLPSEIVSTVLEYTRGGTAGVGGARLCVLAATRWDEGGSHGGVRYCELSPGGLPSDVTRLIERAGEPDAVLLPSLDGFEERAVIKFVIWTSPGVDGLASMPATVTSLSTALDGTGATILDHGERWCEVLPPGVNKGSGVLRLLEHLGVPPADTLACGDAENDVEMLRLVGLGAAVANAQPDALAAADVIVASNVDDGVADAVRRFVLPQAAAA